MSDVHTARTQIRVAWMLVVALALCGYFAVLAPGERRLQAIESHAHDLYQLANRNERMLESAAGLVAARERVARDLARLGSDRGMAATALPTLRLLQSEALHNHVVVTALSPDGVQVSPRAAGLENVTIVLRGTYRNLLGAIADLSKHDVLMEVLDVGLAATSDGFGAREVDATLHATIYRRIEAIMKENGIVQLAPR